jgi:hypothetical protein
MLTPASELEMTPGDTPAFCASAEKLARKELKSPPQRAACAAPGTTKAARQAAQSPTSRSFSIMKSLKKCPASAIMPWPKAVRQSNRLRRRAALAPGPGMLIRINIRKPPSP